MGLFILNWRKISDYDEESNEGSFILDVDSDYPNKVHDLHKDYPLGPEIISVSDITKKKEGSKGRRHLEIDFKGDGQEEICLFLLRSKVLFATWAETKEDTIICLEQSNFLKPCIDLKTEKKTDDSLHDKLTISWHDNQPRSSAITHPYIWSKNQ